MHAAKQIRFKQERAAVARRSRPVEVLDRVDPAEAELGLGLDRGDVLDSREGLGSLRRVGHVSVEQRQVELDVLGFLEELAGQEQPGFGRVDVLVQVEDEVVGRRSSRQWRRRPPAGWTR